VRNVEDLQQQIKQLITDNTISEAKTFERVQSFLKNPTEDQKIELITFLSKHPVEILKQLAPIFEEFPELKSCSVDALIKKNLDDSNYIDILSSQIQLLDSELNEFLTKYNNIKEEYTNVREAIQKIASEDDKLELLEDATSDNEVEMIESRAKIIDLARKIIEDHKNQFE
jgi:hypothetical protein